ncbi:MAG TPA: maltose alpha-D-glucosyltransferase [Solirubrobacteraceae bacterium]|nr:maltose alpha-D-glucosyltransferase [Solirubrobacteraceae bacterium]
MAQPNPNAPLEEDPADHEPSEITYDEQFYPARPKRLRPSARRVSRPVSEADGEPTASNAHYVAWLVSSSMLHDANAIAEQLSGTGTMFQNPFAHPDSRAALVRASVWFTAYPLSFITREGQSFLAGLADPVLWNAFSAIGIDAVHTGPVKKAGGLDGWRQTPSVDGHFDRISMEVDPEFGSEHDFRRLCLTADDHDGVIIDDIVPGHTGKGADFRLAELAYQDYPGIYHMVSVAPEDWHLLPEVPPGRDSVNLSAKAEAGLEQASYIIGRLQRVIFYEEGFKETNWSATRPVKGLDGVERRWVYLHYFKDGQPSINWLDPSFAGMRLVMGDALHSLADLGSGALRLDANGFLGVEKSAEGLPAWSEGHPLSEAANHFIASMIRKTGGFSFQELNLTIDDIQAMSESGADLSYDFVNRPAYHHALVMADTEFLRLTLRLARDIGVAPVSLVHGLQNHDELTHELVHFATGHSEDEFPFRGKSITGGDLAVTIRGELTTRLTGEAAPYNRTFTTNGIACTTASVIAAALRIRDLAEIGEPEIDRIRRAHLLLAMFNALQPGVFALSGWDLAGMLTLDPASVADLIRDGDTRWINRGSHDLIGIGDLPPTQWIRLPAGRSLYGSLPEQLLDPSSFASQLKRTIEVRREHEIHLADQLDIPEVPNKAMLVLLHKLPSGQQHLLILNFSEEDVMGTVRSELLVPHSRVSDMFGRWDGEATVDELNSFQVTLGPFEGFSLLIQPPIGPLPESKAGPNAAPDPLARHGAPSAQAE